jgi:tetratricopeptide (TPR) repeat protein
MRATIPILLAVGLAAFGFTVPSAAIELEPSLQTQPENAQITLVPKPGTEGLEPAVTTLLESTYAGLAEISDPASRSNNSERATRWGEAGEIFHAHGALESALACYRRAHEIDSETARWPYLLGFILKGNGELDEAMALLEASNRIEPNPFTAFRIGQTYLEEGRVEEALRTLEPLREIEGLEAAVLAELGKAALLTGDYASAVADLSAGLALQPQALSLEFPLSQAYRGAGDLPNAQRHAERGGPGKVRAFDPILQEVGERSVSSETYVAMGAQALKAGRAEVAAAAYSKAVELNPDNQRAWMNLGVLAMEAGDRAEAEAAFRQALELEPEYGFAHFNLAKLLSQGNRSEEALGHYRAAVAANPRNIEFGMAYADQLMRAGEWLAAAGQYQAIAAETPDSARALYLRSLALVAAGNFEAAAISAWEAWQINPDNPSIAGAFIRLTSVVGSNPDASARALEVALGLHRDQRSVESAEQLAMALAANGRLEEAASMQQSLVGILERDAAPEPLVLFARQNLARYRANQLATAPWPSDSGPEQP